MTFNELLGYLIGHCKYDIADGDVSQTFAAARNGSHKNAIAGHVIDQLFSNSKLDNVDGTLERTQAVNALGPVRLFYMKDDAPVEGFRLVEDIVHKIDGAYNDEALRNR